VDYDAKEEFLEHIGPITKALFDACVEHNIPMFMTFVVKVENDEYLASTSIINEVDGRSAPHLKEFAGVTSTHKIN